MDALLITLLSIVIGMCLYIIYYKISNKKEKEHLFYRDVVGSLIILSIALFLFFSLVPAALLIQKAIGLMLFLAGYFLIFKYPYSQEYNRGYELTGVFMGFVTIAIGIGLLLF